MRIQLSDHFTTGKLLRFVAPSIVMMIFTSVYGVVDGLFVSNFVGKTAFAAVNLIFPLLMILGALGFMIGTGGSALVARTLGEGDSGRAQRYFSMLVYVTIGGGIVFSVLGLLFLRPIAVLLGAQGAMLEDCVVYGGILLAGQTMFMLQNVFQSFLITAEKPHFGLGVTVAAGLTNIILDFLFIAVFRWGVAGHGRQPVCGRRRTAAVFCPAQPQPFAAWKNEAGQPCIAESLHQWLVGADDQPLFFTGDSAVQFSAHAAGGGGRHCRLWRHHVRQLYFHCHFHRLFHRQRARGGIPSWSGEQHGAEKPVPQKPAAGGRGRSGTDCSCRGTGSSADKDIRGL